MPRPPEPVDWTFLMELGLGRLRLAPDVFWSMTPIEFNAALRGAGILPASGGAVPSRGTLAELMGRFPDSERIGDQRD